MDKKWIRIRIMDDQNVSIYSPDNRNNHTDVEYDTCRQGHAC